MRAYPRESQAVLPSYLADSHWVAPAFSFLGGFASLREIFLLSWFRQRGNAVRANPVWKPIGA